jgi:putative hemolysin
MLDIQTVAQNRYPEFFSQPRWVTKPILFLLKQLSQEKKLITLQSEYSQEPGLQFVDRLLHVFDFKFKLTKNEKDHIPQLGPVLIVANQPIGSLDAMALLQLVGSLRKDVKVLSENWLEELDALKDVVITTHERDEKTYYQDALTHLNHAGALIIFPAKDVSSINATGIKDGRWTTQFIELAEASQAPILPIHIRAKNSLLFYLFATVSSSLAKLWLVRETFHHSQKSVDLRIGKLIDSASCLELNLPAKTKARLFRKQLYRLPKNKPSLFKTLAPIAAAEDRQALTREITQCEPLGETKDNKLIYLYRYRENSSVMQEIGRLREQAFRLIGEGTGAERDIDYFDHHYVHIVLWDAVDQELVGAYRLYPTHSKDLAQNKLYTETLFHYQDSAKPMLEAGIELGRSFVQPKYWGSRSLDYLWLGIAAFLRRHPQYRYLFGAVSISNSFSREAKGLMIGYYQHYYGASDPIVKCQKPYHLHGNHHAFTNHLFDNLDSRAGFRVLKEQLSQLGYAVPMLYKQYTELCTLGGTQFHGFNIDPDFQDCVDGLVVVDLSQLTPLKRKRYGLEAHLTKMHGAIKQQQPTQGTEGREH